MAKNRKLILRHTSGSKSGHVEEFQLDESLAITLGRDESAAVRFGDSDDLVSREHARLSVGAGESGSIEVADLGSSNGTFVNKQRLSDSMIVKAGDIVQLGAGGPEIEIDLDPRPEGAAKATRLSTPAPAATRMTAAAAAKPEIGKATVERMISDTKDKSKRQMLTFAAIGLAVVAIVVLVMIFQGRSLRNEVGEQGAAAQSAIADLQSQTPLAPSVIAAANTPAVVKIEFAWRLVDSRSGEPVYHRNIDGVPGYLLEQTASGPVARPWVWRGSEDNTNTPISGAGSGSGFVVTEDGFILTNRHVAASWDYPYSQLGLPGRLYRDAGGQIEYIGLLQMSGSGLLLETSSGIQSAQGLAQGLATWAPSSAAGAEGRLDRINVVFPKTKERIPARTIRISDRADAALIKVDVPTRVSPVEMHDSYSTISPGEQVIVMGYPGVSDEAIVVSRSVDLIRTGQDYQTVPEPTVTVGGIGRVYRADAQAAESSDYLYTQSDSYQLTINATGSGNSGGPVFDDYGRVIAIFAWGRERANAKVTGAVPIKYGMDLLQIQPVVR